MIKQQVSSKNIAIAGAGLVGRLLAWQLLQRGHKVSLYEKTSFSSPRSAAYTAAAMISPMSEVVVSERSIYDMGVQSLKIWPKWIEALNAQSEQHSQYSSNGSIVVAHTADNSELEQFYSDLNYHLGDDNSSYWLSDQQLELLEPDLAQQFHKALFLPDEAYLDNRQLLTNLLQAIQDLGGDCIDQSEISFTPEPRINGNELNEFDTVIDCRGIGAQQTHSQNSSTPLRGVRGEVLWVQTDEVQLNHPIRLMHPRYKIYIVPKPDNCFIVGATEIESQDNSPISVQSTLELCSALYTLNPAFAEARIIEMDANLRPSYFDNLPMIEQKSITSKQHIIRVNGLYRHGYLLAPTLVESILTNITYNF